MKSGEATQEDDIEKELAELKKEEKEKHQRRLQEMKK